MDKHKYDRLMKEVGKKALNQTNKSIEAYLELTFKDQNISYSISEILLNKPNFFLTELNYKQKGIFNFLKSVEIRVKNYSEDYHCNFEDFDDSFKFYTSAIRNFNIPDELDSNNSCISKNELDKFVWLMCMSRFSSIAYEDRNYQIAFIFRDIYLSELKLLAVEYGVKIDSVIERSISIANSKKANKRWSKHNEEKSKKKRQYLNIMKEQGFTQYTKTARYIKDHIDTDDTPTYETVKKWLSEADKGDFS